MALDPGSRIGPYEVLGRLGAGGMGEVLRARDIRLGREVALKILPAHAAGDAERLRRFITEAKTVSSLNHPNILTLHEIGESERGPYLVTEVVEGETLRARLGRGPLALADALDLAAQVADGLSKAHEAGIVHRDVKPENLMVTRDGFVKILDFGLAKLRPAEDSTVASVDASLTATGVIVGTPAYMSPEQLHGLPADARSDLFALGVVLDEMLAGVNPYRRESAAGTISAILTDEPAPLGTRRPGVPREVSDLVKRLVSKDPAQRFSTAREVSSRLRELRAASVSSLPTSAPPITRRLPSFTALGLGALFLLLVGVVVVAVRRNTIPTPPTPPSSADETAVLPPPRESAGVVPIPEADIELPAHRLGVAVFPIEDESGDPALAEASIGRVLTDAFVQMFSDIPAFYVTSPLRLDGVARALGRPFQESAGDLSFARKICEKADAKAMLTGTIRKIGSTYVMHATLTELATERLLDSFQSESKTLDDLLSSFTRSVGDELRSKYSSPESARRIIAPLATDSLRAYEHYARASEYTLEGNWDGAKQELTAALEIDPQMALAWSELACAHSFSGDNVRASAASRRAQALLDRVNQKERRWIELNAIWVDGGGERYLKEAKRYIADFPDDRQGYFYAGLAFEYLEQDWVQALEYYDKAYRITPNYFPITQGILDCLMKLGRTDDAIKALERYLSVPMAGDHGRRIAQTRLDAVRQGSYKPGT